jgi:hypothetical protein
MQNSLILLLASVSFASAQSLDSSQVLQFPVSKDGLTRISIENDGIEDIYAYPTEFADNIQHHKSGHVFVVADTLDKPIYVTLITKRGVPQDLKLIPTAKKTEPIILTFENEETQAKDRQEQVTSLMKSFLQGSIPAGFYPIQVNETSRSAGSVSGVLVQAFQNAKYRVLVFDVKSESGKQGLNSQTMWVEGDLAVSFDQQEIDQGQTAKMIVIQKI